MIFIDRQLNTGDQAQLAVSIKREYLDFEFRIVDKRFLSHDYTCIVATHHSTVDFFKANRISAKKEIYFVQDFEPFFYEWGENSQQALLSYTWGTDHVFFGKFIGDFLPKITTVSRDHQIPFFIDEDCYNQGTKQRNKNILLYFRDDQPRRLPEFTLKLAERLHQKTEFNPVLYGGGKNNDFENLGSISDKKEAGSAISRKCCRFVLFNNKSKSGWLRDANEWPAFN